MIRVDMGIRGKMSPNLPHTEKDDTAGLSVGNNAFAQI